jgi:hypothetical protein
MAPADQGTHTPWIGRIASKRGMAMLQDVMEIKTSVAGLAEYSPGLDLRLDHHLGLPIDTNRATEAFAGDSEVHFAGQLLAALATMAVRSKRRQADLSAALCRSKLDHDPQRVTTALRKLERDGCIEQLVPLYDGGVLMSVTSRGIETLSAGPRWTMLDGAGFLRG